MVHAFIEGFRVSPNAVWIEMKSLFYRVCDFTVDLEDFKTQTCRISLPCYSFFSYINIVYSLFYRMHMEEVNRLLQFC